MTKGDSGLYNRVRTSFRPFFVDTQEMITYEYECKECGQVFEVEQSIKDDAFVTCPACSKDGLFRVIHSPLYVQVIGEATTVGQLAERNAKKMSSDEMRMAFDAQKTKKTISRIPEQHRPTSVKQEQLPETPAWMDKARTKTTSDVGKMNPAQLEKYVATGD